MNPMAKTLLGLLAAAAATLSPVVLADENQIADKVHLGVASCASSVCHGKLQRQPDSNVWLNEYRIWTGAGKHSQAYRLLENDASRRIAENLGLASATTAKVCLDCHADNVPADKRGPRFQISDGVSCEACHGGAEEWIESHAASNATHGMNLVAGMYPTETPALRAQLCLSCHMGNDDKFAGHDIMGAGHPRLSFELEAFQTNQPAHFDVDDDYRERKGDVSGFPLWLAGQVEAATRFADIVRTRIDTNGAPYPELALYDCHACHHLMDDQRWSSVRGPVAGPGTLRIQDPHALILQAVAGVIDSAEIQTELAGLTADLVRGGHTDVAVAKVAAGRLAQWLRTKQREWSARQFGPDEVRAVRRAIVESAARGELNDYVAAEQAVLAMETLSYALGDRANVATAIDRVFDEVADDASFDPRSFANTAAAIRSGF
jgi:hypothetical protein